jgi:FkbM family methyltransferase
MRWQLKPTASDRMRLLLHRAVMAPPNLLRLRGGPKASLLLRRVVGDYENLVVAEDDDIRISFDGFDRYWMRVFFRDDLYEPELYRLFSRMTRLRDFHFIDGGANIGFWSAVLTAKRFGITRAVAVEASPTTYATLERTAELCNHRFATEHRALTREPGAVTFEQGLAPASRRIATQSGTSVSVEATTIDLLVAKYELHQRDLIVKLDVEGAELDCIVGAAGAFAAGAIFVYEDHGKDPHSLLTGQLLERGARCWSVDDDGTLRPIASAAEASALKLNPARGYNFVCTSAAVAECTPLERRLFG